MVLLLNIMSVKGSVNIERQDQGGSSLQLIKSNDANLRLMVSNCNGIIGRDLLAIDCTMIVIVTVYKVSSQ